uniref:ShKT domain-containing protein n=1 Tax=Syphacia muris TaxID=451379 RepID=A0A0N5ASV1_9BILA
MRDRNLFFNLDENNQPGSRSRRQSCTCTISNLPPQCSCRPLAIQGNAVQLTCACDPPRTPRCTCIHPTYLVPDPRRYCSLSCIPSCRRACENEHYLKKRCPELCTSSCSKTCSVIPLITSQYNQPLGNAKIVKTTKIQNIGSNVGVPIHQQRSLITASLLSNQVPSTTTVSAITASSSNLSNSSMKPIVPDVVYLEKQNESPTDAKNDNAVEQLISAAPQLGKALLMTAEEELERFVSRAFEKLNETKATMTPQQREDAKKVFQAINSVGKLQSLLLDSMPEASAIESHNSTANSSNKTVITTTLQTTRQTSLLSETTTQTPPTTTAAAATTTIQSTTTTEESLPVVLRQAFDSYVKRYRTPTEHSRNSSLNQATAAILNHMRKAFYHILPTSSSSFLTSTSTVIDKPFIVLKNKQTSKCIATCEESCRPQCIDQRIPLNRCVLYCASACKETCKIKSR